MFFYADQFLRHRHSYTIQNQRSNLSQKKDSWKNVHDSNESLWFFCLDRLLRIEYAFSHYIYLRSFHTGNQLVSFWYGVSLSETPFLSIYFFTVIINIFSVAHVPHHFSLFFFSRQHKHRRYCEWPGGSFFLHSGPPPGGLPPWGEGAPKTSFFMYIYMYIFTHAHLVTLQNVQRCCFLAFFLLIIYIFWSISSIHTTREDFWNPCTGDQQQV